MRTSGPGRPEGPRGGALAVEVLGPLRVSVAGRPVEVTSRRLRALLATLALSPGQVVSLDRLAAAVWDEDLPADARKAIQTYVARLRGHLGGEAIDTSPEGYRLRAEPDQVDALRFLRLLDAATAAPDAAAERAGLAEALALWRGEPFEGLRSDRLEAIEGLRLTERYLTAVERRVELDLAAGEQATLAARLGELVGRYPLRESLWARLLVVLDRCGRQAEALERYAELRARLVEELGTDPGPELRAIHADLLAGRPVEVAPGGGPALVRPLVPRQLPAGVAAFVGRREAIATLEAVLGGGQGWTGRIVAIAGSAGVGKTALSIHLAHRLVGCFPDGQLHVDLQGATTGVPPLEPLEVLGRFLRSLGVDPAAVPAELDEAGGLFRSVVADRRLLVVLDNAADAAQVVPLLPGGPGCGALVTSRQLLAGVDAAHQLDLDVLTPAEALELLGRAVGRARVTAEPEAAGEVIRWCDRLPLALRIAGTRLAARPAWPLRALAERLADARRRLDELALGDVGVRASFDVSLERLRGGDEPADKAAAEAFGLIGALDGPELGTPVVARLLDVSEETAGAVLERLVDAQLLDTPTPGRYRLHDLLRLYARELAHDQHGGTERGAALSRALGLYVATAWRTLGILRRGDYRLARADERWHDGGLELGDDQAALGWLEAERANLLAAVQQAASDPDVPDELAVQLTHALYGFFAVRRHWRDWTLANELALELTRRSGDLAGQAQAGNDLGVAHWAQGRYDQALACHRESLALRRRLGDRHGESASLCNLGIVYERQGRYDEAAACHREALRIDQDLGDRWGQAIHLGNLSVALRLRGHDDEALAYQRESVAIHRERGDRSSEARGLNALGKLHELRGELERALTAQRESLAVHRALGDRSGEATCLVDLGAVHRRQGRHDQALAHQREGLAIHQDVGDPDGQARGLRELGMTLWGLGRHREARDHWRQALTLFERLRAAAAGEVRALLAQAPAPE